MSIKDKLADGGKIVINPKNTVQSKNLLKNILKAIPLTAFSIAFIASGATVLSNVFDFSGDVTLDTYIQKQEIVFELEQNATSTNPVKNKTAEKSTMNATPLLPYFKIAQSLSDANKVKAYIQVDEDKNTGILDSKAHTPINLLEDFSVIERTKKARLHLGTPEFYTGELHQEDNKYSEYHKDNIPSSDEKSKFIAPYNNLATTPEMSGLVVLHEAVHAQRTDKSYNTQYDNGLDIFINGKDSVHFYDSYKTYCEENKADVIASMLMAKMALDFPERAAEYKLAVATKRNYRMLHLDPNHDSHVALEKVLSEFFDGSKKDEFKNKTTKEIYDIGINLINKEGSGFQLTEDQYLSQTKVSTVVFSGGLPLIKNKPKLETVFGDIPLGITEWVFAIEKNLKIVGYNPETVNPYAALSPQEKIHFSQWLLKVVDMNEGELSIMKDERGDSIAVKHRNLLLNSIAKNIPAQVAAVSFPEISNIESVETEVLGSQKTNDVNKGLGIHQNERTPVLFKVLSEKPTASNYDLNLDNPLERHQDYVLKRELKNASLVKNIVSGVIPEQDVLTMNPIMAVATQKIKEGSAFGESSIENNPLKAIFSDPNFHHLQENLWQRQQNLLKLNSYSAVGDLMGLPLTMFANPKQLNKYELVDDGNSPLLKKYLVKGSLYMDSSLRDIEIAQARLKNDGILNIHSESNKNESLSEILDMLLEKEKEKVQILSLSYKMAGHAIYSPLVQPEINAKPEGSLVQEFLIDSPKILSPIEKEKTNIIKKIQSARAVRLDTKPK